MHMPRWMDKMYARGEQLVISLTSPRRVGLLMKWIFKFPLLLNKIGLGALMAPYVLILTTKGRKTGKLRQTPVEYQYDAGQDRYYVMAGWGGKTDWYRNLRLEPRVTVQIGKRRFEAVAVPATAGEVGEQMLALTKKRPNLAREWSRWTDEPLDGSLEAYVRAAAAFPSVWLKPILGWM